MPQAAVPDVNVAIIRYREFMLKARLERDPAGVWFAIRGLNGLLDPDFKIVFVPQSQYNLMVRAQHLTTCEECGKDISFDPAQVQTRRAGWALRAAGKSPPPRLHVQCANCHNWQHIDVQKSDVGVKVVSPLDLRELPLPPKHKSMPDLVYREHDFWAWFDLAVYVIEDRIRRFREKYRTTEEQAITAGPDDGGTTGMDDDDDDDGGAGAPAGGGGGSEGPGGA